MSRYLFGVLLASLVLTIGSGLGGFNRLFAESSQTTKALPEDGSKGLGSLPIEQAGRLVKRQSQPQPGATQAVGANVGSSPAASSVGMAANSTPSSTPAQSPIPPQPSPNVIPRPSQPAPVVPRGDISPIQPNLVKPENLQPQNQPLDSIPALW
ncbi:MAG: hypothetical protein ACOYMP_01060 [Nodosilinea sp.]